MENTTVFLLALCCCTIIYLTHGFRHIRGCSGMHAEGSALSVSTHAHPGYREGAVLRWTITRLQNKSRLEIECTNSRFLFRGICETPYGENITASWRLEANLKISHVERSMSNISCNLTVPERNYTAVASCPLHVIYPAEVDTCQFPVNKQHWSLDGFCNVTKVYSSRETYRIRVDQQYSERSQNTDVAVNQTKHLTSYTNTSSGLMYYSGKFPFSVPLLPHPGNLDISVTVYPGASVRDMTPPLYIESPDDPALKHCDPAVIIEGGNSPITPCVCRVASLGSPSGRLRWLSNDSVLMTGEYGVRELPFPYEKLKRTKLEQAMSCQVDWIVSRNSTSFTPEFAVCFAQKSAEERSFREGVGLGVGGTMFVELVVVAVLLVLLWRRGLLPTCQCCIPTYAKPSKRKQRQEEKEHTYTDMNVYEPVGAEASSTGAGSTANPGRQDVPASGAVAVYVNRAADLGKDDVISGADAVYVNTAC